MPGKKGKKFGKRPHPSDSDDDMDSKLNCILRINALKKERDEQEELKATNLLKKKARRRSKKKKKSELSQSSEQLLGGNDVQSESFPIINNNELCNNPFGKAESTSVGYLENNMASISNGNTATTNNIIYKFKKKKTFVNGFNKGNFQFHNANGIAKFPVFPNLNKTIYRNISKQRQGLPIFLVRDEVVEKLANTETVIVIGETGSGKTTQIPQYLHEEQLDNAGVICITQPRRVAAISIAKRVAEEMNSEVGNIVGYCVRFEEVSSNRTKLRYVTDGMLLREALSDPLLRRYQWIILDEAHERSINTDILFGVVKKAQQERKLKGKKTLHIIVMSATMDVDHFSSYFNNAHVLYIEGREYPIDVFQVAKKQNDYSMACLVTMLKIHREAPDQEDILIFLTGQEEIEKAVKVIGHVAKDKRLVNCPNLKAFPLYAALPYHKQLAAFHPSVPGERKVIVSTNIAETSVTIPGIKYVIDSGHAKVRTYNSVSGFDDLKVCKISRAQAWQRTGRAGREAPGVCYRTYTNEEFEAMSMNTVPEILKANLADVLLKLFAIGIKDVLNFDFIDKPCKENLEEAQHDLKDLKAIEFKEGLSNLTDLGKKMACFPLKPQYAKLLICGPNYSCTEEMLTIVALLSSETIYVTPNEKKEEAREKIRNKFQSSDGDHITLLNVYKAFNTSANKKVWCRKNFLNYRNLMYATEVRRQLRELCIRYKIPLLSCNEKTEPVLRCLICGLHKNIAKMTLPGKYQTLNHVQEAKIHPSSTLFCAAECQFILYTELVRTEKTYMHTNSKIRSHWLTEFDYDYFNWRIRKN